MQIPALTGIRAIAAYLVFFHHFPVSQWVRGDFDYFREFHIGVTLFFVLSGFLITYRYRDALQLNHKWLITYFQNRFARIYPLYFVLIVLTLIIVQASGEFTITWREWFLNLTLVKGFFDQYKFYGIAQSWSLTVEECFYASAPLIFLASRKGLWRPLVFFTALLAVLLALVAYVPPLTELIGPPRFILLYTFFGRFFEFLTGMFLARQMLDGKIGPPAVKRFPIFTTTGVLGIAGCVAALVLLEDEIFSYGLYHPLGIATNNLVLPLFIVVLYYGLIYERSPLRWLLATRLFDLLGKSSYAFYLIHKGVFYPLLSEKTAALSGWAFGNPVAASVEGALNAPLLQFVITVLLSIAAYKLIEAPLSNLIRKVKV